MPISNQREEIDERILRLIGLDDVFDLDYDTYLTLLKEAIVKGSFGDKKIPEEELALLSNERKRVRGSEGRFKVKKKKITADSFSVGSVRAKIAPASSSRLLPSSIAKSPVVGTLSDDISTIISSLTSILDTLKAQKKLQEDTASFNKRKEEQEKRALAESKLEKRFEGLKKAAEKIIAPVKNILDRIIDFFVKIILGRTVYKLIEWLGNPDNANKVKTIIRFLGDNWPKLLSLYIAFGTSFGKFARGLIGVVIKGTGALIKGAVGLAARAGLKGAGGALKFLGGPKGKLIGAGLELAAVAGGTFALSQGLENFGGIGEQQAPTAKFSGGGFASLKNLFGGFFNGLVSGQKGVDKVPAMLTDGEFVMSRGAVQKYGVDTLEAMNAAGGGTNKPKVVQGTTYAAGGGYIGNTQRSSNVSGRLSQVENILDNLITDNKLRLRETGFKLGFRTAPESRMLPAAGESSANSMRAAQNMRSPIPASRAIVPYTGGGLTRTGVTAGITSPGIPQIRTNMKVPGGFGNIKSLGVEMLANYLMQRGFDKINAMIIANRIDEGKKLTGDKKENYVEKLRNIVDREERWQRSFGGNMDKFLSTILGKETSSQKLSKNARAILEGIGSGAYQGGAIKGGYGLKKQSFDDMPKTQIMTDDKGRPFVGYKAMRNGKPVYVRGPQPGQGTSNPFESLGRMINPGAYKNIDALNARKKYEEASKGNISSLRARGASQATIAKKQSELRKSVKPLPRSKPKPYNPAGGGMGGARGSRAKLSTSKVSTPSFSATNPVSGNAKQKTLGITK